MKCFALLLDPVGCGISERQLHTYANMPRTRGLEYAWQRFGQAAVLTAWDDQYGGPVVARDGRWIAVGLVRLDNRADLERLAECGRERLTDLELILRVVARHGLRHVQGILGDFTFVIWDEIGRTAIAACDAFAVRRLYYTERDNLVSFASRAEVLALEERYEVQYLARLVALHGPSADLTVYSGVRPIPAGTLAVLSQGKLALSQYWSSAAFGVEPISLSASKDIVERCRDLLAESVHRRLADDGNTWAQLSGGLDSSTIVSLVQWLAERGDIAQGLAGTVTFVDRHATGADERQYSDTVIRRWGIPNVTIIDPPTWNDDGYAPPQLDQPSFGFPFHPRDRRLCAAVRTSGGRVLLTGWGGDELFMGSMLFFADWMVRGQFRHAVVEMARRAAIGRVSFWSLAFRNSILPLLPAAVRYRLINDGSPVQPWLRADTLRRYGLATRPPSSADYAGHIGQKYCHAISTKVANLGRLTDREAAADVLDLRHPMLYRPLVEFALQLAPEMRAKPHAHRWVLREAMRGILPEKVRMRVGKPDTGAVLAYSLATQRASLTPLLREPILAELGIVDAGRLRTAFDGAFERTSSMEYVHAQIQSTLAVEAWLQMRSGRWPRGGHRSKAHSHQFTSPPSEGNPRSTV